MKKMKTLVASAAMLFALAGCQNAEEETTEPELEEVEEVEEVEEAETSETSSPDSLSTDLYSFEVSVNGEIHQFPMSFETFEDLGWEYKGDPEGIMLANTHSNVESASRDDIKVYVRFVNFAPEARDVQNTYIGGMTFETFALQDTDAEIILPGDITLGESTLEDIEAAHGKPSEVREGETVTTYVYTRDVYQDWKLSVNKETGVLDQIQVENFSVPDDLEDAEVVQDTPDLITNYEYPESISDDLFDYQIEYSGTIYELPVPVAAFIENGWTKLEDDEQAIAGGDFSRVQLMKDNQTIQASVDNFFDYATVIENSHITRLESRLTGPEVPIELSHGISLGMDKKDFEEAISDYDYEVEEASIITSYLVDDPEGRNSGYTFTLDHETNQISSISLQYNPKTLD